MIQFVFSSPVGKGYYMCIRSVSYVMEFIYYKVDGREIIHLGNEDQVDEYPLFWFVVE